MKNIRLSALFPLLLLAALTLAAAREALPAPGPLKARAAQALINAWGKDLTVIDVRTPGEFAQGHVPDAILLPLDRLPAELDKIPADKPVLLVCRTGRRAGVAFETIRKARPEQEQLWYLDGVPQYKADGGYVFH